MTPVDLLAQSVQYLLAVLAEAYEESLGDPEELDRAFVYRNARNVSELGRDILLLHQHSQFTAAAVAIRSVLESMFCIGATLNVENFAARKVIAECEQRIKRIKKTPRN